jgi:hypothetical protein
MKLPLSGGCQCGALRYEIRAEPTTLYACHCTECQRQSASAFSLSMVVPRQSVVITSGTPKVWRRLHESGRVIDCVFCGDCGARIYHEPERNPAVTIVKPGTLDDTSWLYPVGHIWTGSAQRWPGIPKDTVNYDKQPPEMSRLIAAWQTQQQSRSSGI